MATTQPVMSAGLTEPLLFHVFVFLMKYESHEGQAQLLLNPEPIRFSSWDQTDWIR